MLQTGIIAVLALEREARLPARAFFPAFGEILFFFRFLNIANARSAHPGARLRDLIALSFAYALSCAASGWRCVVLGCVAPAVFSGRVPPPLPPTLAKFFADKLIIKVSLPPLPLLLALPGRYC